ncbi:lantibiotic dehydratase [Streptomyces sp. NPDC006355]|uniref:lantibiotic dehydratase n=1 Tax=Streptomyces sp. NPDC006355 TaxID=3156758 RepID=UPI0033B89423
MTREWTIGDSFVVRHAGMPFDWLESLAAPATLLEAAEEVLAREAALRRTAGKDFRHIEHAVIRCEPRRLPSVPDSLLPAVDAWRAAAEHYLTQYEEADQRATTELRTLLERPEITEAILLSNPDAYRNMLLPLLRSSGPLTSRRRRARRQMYTYVQRFCAKNETVSFFGPMAYGTVHDDDTALRTDLPCRREVFLSHWAGRALSRAIARDTRLLPDLILHRTSNGDALADLPEGADPSDQAAARDVIGRIDATGSTLRTLVRDTGRPAKEVARALRLLLAAGAVDMRLGAGAYDLRPLATLLERLRELPASPARRQWIDRLAGLEARRADLEAGSGPEREHLIRALEEAFTAVTGEDPRRAPGATYADRAIFYEEASSPFDLVISRDVAQRWQQRLRALLEVATGHGLATQRAAVETVCRALGPRRLDLGAYATLTTELFPAPGSTFGTGYAPVYRADEWPAEAERLEKEAAAAPGDRYALIDLCVKASSASDLSEADLLVARIHHHLLVPSWLGTMHPDQDGFAAAAERWVQAQRGRLIGFDFGRRNKGYYRFPGTEVALRPAAWNDSEPAVRRPERFTVTVDHHDVALWDPDGTRVFAYLPLDDFVKYAPFAALSHPQVAHPAVVPPGTGESREATQDEGLAEVRVGGVACQRRRWQVDTNRLGFAAPHARFLELRRLADRTSTRFLFCRSPHERKPYLLDLACPLAADLAGHLAHSTESLLAEVMSPGPDELWLRDARGRRYTSELRIQVTGRAMDGGDS